jgi:hypothetical protein
MDDGSGIVNWVNPGMISAVTTMPPVNPTFLEGNVQGMTGVTPTSDGNNLAFWNTLIDGELLNWS